MGDDHHGQVQGLLQVLDEVVEARRRNGIQASGGLVQEQHLGLKGQGPGQRCALDHASGELGGEQLSGAHRQAGQADLELRQLLAKPGRELEVLAHRQLHVLEHGKTREQRPPLEDHAPVALIPLPPALGEVQEVPALVTDPARLRPV